jgi:hypothetical protein
MLLTPWPSNSYKRRLLKYAPPALNSLRSCYTSNSAKIGIFHASTQYRNSTHAGSRLDIFDLGCPPVSTDERSTSNQDGADARLTNEGDFSGELVQGKCSYAARTRVSALEFEHAFISKVSAVDPS